MNDVYNGDYIAVIHLQQKTWWLEDSWHGNSRLDMWIDEASWAKVNEQRLTREDWEDYYSSVEQIDK